MCSIAAFDISAANQRLCKGTLDDMVPFGACDGNPPLRQVTNSIVVIPEAGPSKVRINFTPTSNWRHPT